MNEDFFLISKQMHIGFHYSFTKDKPCGLAEAIKHSHMTAGAFFVQPPRSATPRTLSDEFIAKFIAATQEVIDFNYLLPHSAYTVNLSNKSQNSFNLFDNECKLLNAMQINRINIHPGNNKDNANLIVLRINKVMEDYKDFTVVVENSATPKTFGSTIDELAFIATKCPNAKFTIDTSHAYVAGYDIANKNGIQKFIKEFDSKIGLGRLGGWHLNNSTYALGSHHDVHTSVFKGNINVETFSWLLEQDFMKKIPIILERCMYTIDEAGCKHFDTQEANFIRQYM